MAMLNVEQANETLRLKTPPTQPDVRGAALFLPCALSNLAQAMSAIFLLKLENVSSVVFLHCSEILIMDTFPFFKLAR